MRVGLPSAGVRSDTPFDTITFSGLRLDQVSASGLQHCSIVVVQEMAGQTASSSILDNRFSILPVMVRLLRTPRGKLIALVACCTAACGLATAWMAFQYIPKWYHQPILSRSAERDVQLRLEETFERISQMMAQGERFTLSFSARQLNDILAAQPRLWPAASQWLGKNLQHPCLRITDHKIELATRLRWGEIKSIVHVSVGLGVEGHAVVGRLYGAGAGLLPLPAGWIASRMCPREPHDGMHFDGARLVIDNEFNWPNGDIPFVVREIDLVDERLALTLEPYGY